MVDEFSYEEVAADVLEEYEQDKSFENRFIGFCQNAMKGKAEDADLERLIENVSVDDGSNK